MILAFLGEDTNIKIITRASPYNHEGLAKFIAQLDGVSATETLLSVMVDSYILVYSG